jgi:hypothetical protein
MPIATSASDPLASRRRAHVARARRARPGRSLRVAVLVGALGVLLAACSSGPAGEIEFTGPEDGALINAEQLQQLAFEVTATEERTVDDLELLHGDDAVGETERATDGLRWEPADLGDGEHEVTVVRLPAEDDDADAEPEQLHTWRFAVSATPPELELSSPDGAVVAGEPVLVAGTTEPGATVQVEQTETEAGEDGSFEVELDAAPEGELRLVAIDAAGNSTDDAFTLVTVPSRVEVDAVRGVHVTPHAWASPSHRERIVSMIDDGIINSVALTLKDEGGRVGWNSSAELAELSGANEGVYDLDEVVAELHGMGVHIAGRIVAFRDPMLGQYALDSGNLDWLIQTTDGEPYTGQYGCCFTSFAHPEVIEYNLELAEEAAAAGVDDILWDYIRRPDGSPDAMVVPGLSEDADGATLEDAVIEFARLADERLERYGVGHGASLYGIAADRPTQIAQDVPGLSEHLDYVAPMIYPSHWGPGEYGVADPNRQPYDIITATLDIWKAQTDGTRTRVVPWLEDTTYRAWDRPQQVREQLRASRDQGIEEFLMWDPSVTYTPDAYDRMPAGDG